MRDRLRLSAGHVLRPARFVLLLLLVLLPQGALAKQAAAAIGAVTVTRIDCRSGLIQGPVEVTDLAQPINIRYVGVESSDTGSLFGAGMVQRTPPAAQTPYTGTVSFEFTLANLTTGDD